MRGGGEKEEGGGEGGVCESRRVRSGIKIRIGIGGVEELEEGKEKEVLIFIFNLFFSNGGKIRLGL